MDGVLSTSMEGIAVHAFEIPMDASLFANPQDAHTNRPM